MLGSLFGLLYGPLSALHERAGTLAFGAAWHGRRVALLENLPPFELALDIGCGEGRLLQAMARRSLHAVGIDPSVSVARRARERGNHVAVAAAQALPFPGASFGAVLCTYPGPWIIERKVWDEIARVTAPGATIAILLGGDYTTGRGARVRTTLARIAYGRPDGRESADITALFGHAVIRGASIQQRDAWGSALFWIGQRAESDRLV